MTFYFLCIYILDIDPLYRSIVKLSEDNFSKLEISFNDQKAYFAPARISLDQRVAFIHLILSVHWIFERSYWTVSLNQTWDEELATIAQRWADQCNFDHDCNDCRRVGKCNFQSKVICYHLIIIAIHLEPSWFWLIDNLLDYGRMTRPYASSQSIVPLTQTNLFDLSWLCGYFCWLYSSQHIQN